MGRCYDLTYCKIEDAREVVEKLQVGGAKLSPSLMINALMNCSFLVVPSGTKIEEMEITEQDIKREFRKTVRKLYPDYPSSKHKPHSLARSYRAC